MLSVDCPDEMHAENNLPGRVVRMSEEGAGDSILVEVSVCRMHLTARVTRMAARSLGLLPGVSVRVIFEAAALKWH
jgi:ABC-type molybdate transport system ATPase subunit